MSTNEVAVSPAPKIGLRLAVIALVLSAACWGLATVMTKGALAAIPPFTLLVLQLAASVVFLWIAVIVTGGRIPRTTQRRRAALTGLLEPGLAYGVGVPGLLLTSAANASVIGTAEPAFVCLLAWFVLKQRPEPRLLLAILGAMIGIALLTISGDELGRGHWAGDVLVLSGTLFAAIYVVASSRFVALFEPLPLAAMQHSTGLAFALLLLAGATVLGVDGWPDGITRGMLMLGLASGLVQYALAFWLYLIGLKVLRASEAALFLALIPVFGVGGAMLFLGENVTFLQWVGTAVVIVTVAAMARRSGPQP